jgi:hypothetical protein
MRRFLMLAALALVCFPITTAIAHEGPATIVIKAAQKKQPPVTFAHSKHQKQLAKSCDTCHHTQKGLTEKTATATNVDKCTKCHLDPKGKVPSMREMSMTANPFHIKCIGCHKEQKATHKDAPVVCTGCHKKTA